MRYPIPRAPRAAFALLGLLLLAGCGSAAAPTAQAVLTSATPQAAATATVAPAALAPAPPTVSPSAPAVAPAGTSAAAPAATALPTAPAATPTAAPAGPRTVATGQLVKTNQYNGMGQVTIVQQPDGSLVARLTNFAVDDGPRLVVYLTREARPATRAAVERGFVSLGPLKGFQGDFEYAIPAGADLSAYAGLIVYCAEFHVTFLAAPLAK